MQFCLPIIDKFINKIYVLSLQKFSSNIIEKCIEKGNEELMTKFINEVCIFTRIVGNNLF